MEFSLGGEHFAQFVAQNVSAQFIGSDPEKYRWRPMVTARYKKFLDSGNYFGFGLHFARSSWGEEVLVSGFSDVILTGGEEDFLIFEQNEETKLAGSYQYSFLINKAKNSNFQFFVGGAADLYTSFANKRETDFFFFPFLRRNITGLRFSTVPEIMYLFPNSRANISFRAIIPIVDFRTVRADFRQSSFSSFIRTRTVSNNFQFVPILRSRFEIGFGYFLK
jgi:hypothetical protein